MKKEYRKNPSLLRGYLLVGVLYLGLSIMTLFGGTLYLVKWNILLQLVVGVVWVAYGWYLLSKPYLVQDGMHLHKNDFLFWTVDLQDVVAIKTIWRGYKLETAEGTYRFQTEMMKDKDLRILQTELGKLEIAENPFRKK